MVGILFRTVLLMLFVHPKHVDTDHNFLTVAIPVIFIQQGTGIITPDKRSIPKNIFHQSRKAYNAISPHYINT